SYVSEDLITGENLDNRGLSRLSRSMEKHGLLVLGFDPDTIEDYLAKFGLVTLDHRRPQEFKQRYVIQQALGRDVIEVERFVLAQVNECTAADLVAS
ncbi:MAG: hypothetical protein P8N76_12745, partial [Pirellulaceae bacterium]|nr:hypothetical protein [Pirellulaceae bacterium]